MKSKKKKKERGRGKLISFPSPTGPYGTLIEFINKLNNPAYTSFLFYFSLKDQVGRVTGGKI
jgi:hypothetical protein